MKTIQNNIWMRFLIIGIIISGIQGSCNKIREELIVGEFVFINQSNHAITYPVGLEKFNLSSNSTIMIEDVQGPAGKKVIPKYFGPAIAKDKNFKHPLVIKFDGTKCWQPAPESEHSPLNINSYIAEKLGERKYKFTYTFTEEDYKRASDCQ